MLNERRSKNKAKNHRKNFVLIKYLLVVKVRNEHFRRRLRRQLFAF